MEVLRELRRKSNERNERLGVEERPEQSVQELRALREGACVALHALWRRRRVAQQPPRGAERRVPLRFNEIEFSLLRRKPETDGLLACCAAHSFPGPKRRRLRWAHGARRLRGGGGQGGHDKGFHCHRIRTNGSVVPSRR